MRQDTRNNLLPGVKRLIKNFPIDRWVSASEKSLSTCYAEAHLSRSIGREVTDALGKLGFMEKNGEKGGLRYKFPKDLAYQDQDVLANNILNIIFIARAEKAKKSKQKTSNPKPVQYVPTKRSNKTKSIKSTETRSCYCPGTYVYVMYDGRPVKVLILGVSLRKSGDMENVNEFSGLLYHVKVNDNVETWYPVVYGTKELLKQAIINQINALD